LFNIAFNFERLEVGPYQVSIWDLPGRKNLRIFWPNFFRNIDFHGVIYMIDYDSKDNLDEAVRVMHDLLTEEELKNVDVLVILNYTRKDYNETENYNQNVDYITSSEKLDSVIVSEMKNNIYFELIPQMNKELYYMDLYNDSVGNESIKQTLKSYFSKLCS
jgi:signal recognition particle receptor subunit beta